MKSTIQDFLKLESASGILLMIAALLALIVANSPLDQYYSMLLDVPVEFRVGELEIAKPLLLWVNDGLMAVFFFMIGLELKREIMEGELNRAANVLLPAIGAVGGVVGPVAIFSFLNWGDADAMKGWAIPAATDIAFALGLLMLLGPRVPPALKVFLVSLAIFDDLAAIVIIALFYTSELSTRALLTTLVCLIVLAIMKKRGVSSVSPYLWVGLIMWVSVLKSGVHATLAGVALAGFIPLSVADDPGRSPLRELEHDLHTLVAFAILPIFAFVNAGISFRGVALSDLVHPVPLGIAAGLFVGKQLGVFGFCWLAVRSGMARLPAGATWGSLYGVSILCGVGFTMSLFVGSLAFESTASDVKEMFDERLGILLGSAVSGVIGYALLAKVLPKTASNKGSEL
jgi:NhaA family Na+:H+ antiporter